MSSFDQVNEEAAGDSSVTRRLAKVTPADTGGAMAYCFRCGHRLGQSVIDKDVSTFPPRGPDWRWTPALGWERHPKQSARWWFPPQNQAIMARGEHIKRRFRLIPVPVEVQCPQFRECRKWWQWIAAPTAAS